MFVDSTHATSDTLTMQADAFQECQQAMQSHNPADESIDQFADGYFELTLSRSRDIESAKRRTAIVEELLHNRQAMRHIVAIKTGKVIEK